MANAKVTVEFTGRIEIDTQNWSDESKLNQIKKQAADSIRHWTILVKDGSGEPKPINFIKARVTEVIIPLEG